MSVEFKKEFYCHGTRVTVTQNARTTTHGVPSADAVVETAKQLNKTLHSAFVSGCGRDKSSDIFLSADKYTAEKWWI